MLASPLGLVLDLGNPGSLPGIDRTFAPLFTTVLIGREILTEIIIKRTDMIVKQLRSVKSW